MTQLAMTQNFARVATEEKDDKKYLRYKTIDTKSEIENFKITSIKGYHGNTIACRSKGIYDTYRVFDKEGNLIIETEDEIIELPEGYNINQIIVYAYNQDFFKTGIGKIVEELPSRKKSENYNLTVVVPLYNSELFMCRTIDSILSSSLKDIEIILIDDGSQDNTRKIAQRYEKEYGCITSLHQENKGVSHTRNKGIELAKGEYLAFCDNDDIPHPLMYEILYHTCKEQKTDIAICPALIRNDINDKELYLTCSNRKEDTVIYSFNDLVENRGTKGNIFWVAVWNKIVKTEIAKLTKFPTDYTGPGVLYEDVAYTSSLYSYIEKFAHCKKALYTWDKRKQKTVGTASTRHQKEDNEYVWKMFIYGYTYALYNKSGKNLEDHDYTHFKRLIESYDKFDRPSPLKTYWDNELRKLIISQKLYENKKIMGDSHLANIVKNFIY